MAKGVEAVTPNGNRGSGTLATRASDVRTDDWPVQATDAIVKVVGTAHDKITGPIQTVSRAIVYGLLAAVLGVIAFVLMIVLAVRLTNNYLPDAVFGREHIWAAYGIVGFVFSVFGILVMRRGRRAAVEGDD